MSIIRCRLHIHPAKTRDLTNRSFEYVCVINCVCIVKLNVVNVKEVSVSNPILLDIPYIQRDEQDILSKVSSFPHFPNHQTTKPLKRAMKFHWILKPYTSSLTFPCFLFYRLSVLRSTLNNETKSCFKSPDIHLCSSHFPLNFKLVRSVLFPVRHVSHHRKADEYLRYFWYFIIYGVGWTTSTL